MNKKINIILILLLIVVLLAGCSNSTTTNNEAQDNDTRQEGNEPADEDSNSASNEDQDSNEDNQNGNVEDNDQDANDEDSSKYSDEIQDDLYTYELDTEYSIDLDKDGQADKVVYSIEDYVVYMIINGNKFELDERCSDLMYYRFRTVDIDSSDFNEEVILREADPLAGNVLNFYRYDGKDFYCVGSILVSYLNDNKEEIVLDSSGKITAQNSSYIMEEGIYNKNFIINESENLEEIMPEDIYTYISPITSKVNKEIRGYNDKSIDESYETIPVGDEIVIYGEIGNWLNIKWNDKELWVNDDELTHYDPNWPDVKFEFDGISFWS